MRDLITASEDFGLFSLSMLIMTAFLLAFSLVMAQKKVLPVIFALPVALGGAPALLWAVLTKYPWMVEKLGGASGNFPELASFAFLGALGLFPVFFALPLIMLILEKICLCGKFHPIKCVVSGIISALFGFFTYSCGFPHGFHYSYYLFVLVLIIFPPVLAKGFTLGKSLACLLSLQLSSVFGVLMSLVLLSNGKMHESFVYLEKSGVSFTSFHMPRTLTGVHTPCRESLKELLIMLLAVLLCSLVATGFCHVRKFKKRAGKLPKNIDNNA